MAICQHNHQINNNQLITEITDTVPAQGICVLGVCLRPPHHQGATKSKDFKF